MTVCWDEFFKKTHVQEMTVENGQISIETLRNQREREREREMEYFRQSRGTYGKLIFDTSDVEQRFNFLPQFPPWPSTKLQVLSQISLHDDQSQTLLLQFLVIFSG